MEKNGKGRYIFKNGKKFHGFFFKGKAHGSGTLFDRDGSVLGSGVWNCGKLEQEDKKSSIHKVQSQT